MKIAETFEARLQKNNLYYEKFSSQVATRTEKRDYQKWMELFLANIPYGGLILDIGCGTGIHLRQFRDRGYDVMGLEPSHAMRKLAVDEGLVVHEGAFETIPQLNLPLFSGIWCAASLLHVPKDDLPNALAHIHELLQEKGSLFITVRIGSSAKWDRYDENDGDAERFIQLYEEEMLLAALASAGFEVTEYVIEQSNWGRPAPWISLIAIKK